VRVARAEHGPSLGDPGADPTTMPEPEPPRSQLRRLLERPDARPRVSRAVASLLAASILALAAFGALVIWHLVRRGRLIRDRLNPPRPVHWPTVGPIARDPGTPPETNHDDNDERRES
jgi:hypothetical protein